MKLNIMAVIVKVSFSNQNLIGFLFLTKLSLCIVRALLRKYNIFICALVIWRKGKCFRECFTAKESPNLLSVRIWHLCSTYSVFCEGFSSNQFL